MVTLLGGFCGFLAFGFASTKNEIIVEQEIDKHNNCGSEDEGASGQDELMGKGEMKGFRNAEGEIVEWGEKAEKLGKKRAKNEGNRKIPDEEFVN